MNKARRILTLIVTAGLLMAFTSVSGGYWPDPLTACENNRSLQMVLGMLQRAGYDLVSIEEEPIAYLVPPEGDYDWGRIVHTLVLRPGTETKMRSEIIISARVWYYDPMGYTVTSLALE